MYRIVKNNTGRPVATLVTSKNNTRVVSIIMYLELQLSKTFLFVSFFYNRWLIRYLILVIYVSIIRVYLFGFMVKNLNPKSWTSLKNRALVSQKRRASSKLQVSFITRVKQRIQEKKIINCPASCLNCMCMYELFCAYLAKYYYKWWYCIVCSTERDQLTLWDNYIIVADHM